MTWETSVTPHPVTTPTRPPAASLPIRVWVEDESRFGLMTVLRRRLTLRGVKPVAAYQHQFDFIFLYGAVAPATGDSFFLELPCLDPEHFQIFVDAFGAAFPDSLNLVVLDNGSFHTTPKLRLPNNVRFVHTPPYTPEVNPMERVWEDLKADCAGMIHSTLDHLSDAMCGLIQALTPIQLSSLTSFPFFRKACDALYST